MSTLPQFPADLAISTPGQTTALTSHQERLWFIDEFERGRVYEAEPTYHNIPVLLHVQGVVDAAALQAAVHALVARHDALRTTIGAAGQHVWTSRRIDLAIVDAGAATLDATIAGARQEALEPFRLEQGPLFRATLYRRSGVASPDGLILLTVHHIIADLWSTDVLAAELVTLYEAIVAGDAPALPETGGFAAYAEWQRFLPDAVFDRARAFWTWQLSDQLTPLELPYIRTRHHIHMYAAAIDRFAIDRELLARIEAASVRESTALADFLLTGFVTALHACSRQRDIVTGMPHPNRELGLERVVGPLANLLVLRLRPDPGTPFRTLLQQAQRTVRLAAANRAMPFDRVVQHLRPPKDMSRTALFDVLFQVVEPWPAVPFVRNGTWTRLEDFVGFGKYDVNLTLARTGDGLTAHLQYNRELFDAAFIADLRTLFETVLARAADDTGQSVRQLGRLPSALAARQINLLRRLPGRRPAHATLDTAFEAIATANPDRVAIVSDHGQLSYRALAEASRRVSRALFAADVRPGTPVAIFVDRSPDAVVAMLGILRVGASYVPIDPAYPPLRIADLLDDAEAAVVVTNSAHREALDRYLQRRPVPIIAVDTCAAFSGAPLASRAIAGGVAYSIYTSGSTGRPKGCLVTHANAAQLVLSQAAGFRFGGEDVWTWCHSYCFDFSVWEIFGTLLHGSRGVLLSRPVVRDPALLAQALIREQVSVLNQTPAAGYRLAEHLVDAPITAHGLRCFIFGGDALSPARLQEWSARHPRAQIVNMYGITETTVHVTEKRLDALEIANDSPSVGRALPNAAIYVMADDGALLPMGVLGEIAVAGEGVSLGYWRRPDLTASRFVPDPFSGVPGARLYRSGDVGRVLPEGEIAFHGRRDHQVKIRGYRIELGEIERTLVLHPAVAEAAVVAIDGPGQGRALAAFVVPARGGVDLDRLRQHLRERLTPPMVPAAIESMSALPRTTTGKIDRKALAVLAAAPAASSRGFVAARDDREQALARIWADVLGRDAVGIEDDFFEIGGDSILCMQICARAVRAGIALTPKLLFEHSTIAQLSSHLGSASMAPIVAGVGRAPLLPAQAWFFAQRQPEPNHFNQSAWFALAPGIGAADVEAALRVVQQHHDALRLVFVEDDSGISQAMREMSAAPPLATIVLANLSADARDAVLASAVDQAQRALDLHAGPLCRCLFVEQADGQPARLLIVLHHLIADAMSWRLLIDDLDLLLAQRLAGQPLSGLPASVSLLACAQRLADAQHRFPEMAAAACATPDENTFDQYAEVDVRLDEETTAAIARVLARERLGWEVALLAATGHALLQATGKDSASLHVERHGRDLLDASPGGALDTSRTIGWFMTIHRVRVERLAGSALDLVRRVSVDAATTIGTPPSSPLEQTPAVCVNYLGQIDALTRAGRCLTLIEQDTGCAIAPANRRPHAIDVNAVIVDGQLRVRWGYCARLQPQDAMAEQAARCMRFLRELAGAQESDRPYALAPGQLGMFYHTLLRPDDAPEYVIRSTFEIDGPLDVDAFRGSWQQLVERHDALRASFALDGVAGPVQRFAPQATLTCETRDWRDLDRDAIDARLAAWADERARAAIDPGTAPLLSLDLVRIDAERHVVLLQIHHLIVDGWSIALLRHEWTRLYRAWCDGDPVQLPPAGQFRDFLHSLEARDPREAQAFWQASLRLAEPCLLPASPRRGDVAPVVESVSLDVVDRALGDDSPLEDWAARHHLTLNTVVQGLWALVLATLTRQTHAIAGMVVAGRPADVPEVERTVGTFINTLPWRVEIDASAALATWLAGMQADVIEAQRFAWCSLPQIHAWAGLPHDSPLFDTVLVCENYPVPDAATVQGLAIRELRYAIKESVPIVLEYSCSGRLVCRLRYRPDLVNVALVKDAAALLASGVDAMTREPAGRVGQLASLLVSELDRRGEARRRAFAELRRQGLGERLSTPGAGRS